MATMTASTIHRGRVKTTLVRRLSRLILGSVIGAGCLAPTVVAAQTTSCDPAYLTLCALPGWDDPLPADCEIWEWGYGILAPPYPCLPPLGPGRP
jgi:hypothetical protein